MKYVIVMTKEVCEYGDYDKIINDTYLLDIDMENFDLNYEFDLYVADIYNTNGIKCSCKKNEVVRLDFWEHPKNYKGRVKEMNNLIKTVNQKFKKELTCAYFLEKVLQAEKLNFCEYNLF